VCVFGNNTPLSSTIAPLEKTYFNKIDFFFEHLYIYIITVKMLVQFRENGIILEYELLYIVCLIVSIIVIYRYNIIIQKVENEQKEKEQKEKEQKKKEKEKRIQEMNEKKRIQKMIEKMHYIIDSNNDMMNNTRIN
jgi:mannitol-specific phosphotransferase system IIBC component